MYLALLRVVIHENRDVSGLHINCSCVCHVCFTWLYRVCMHVWCKYWKCVYEYDKNVQLNKLVFMYLTKQVTMGTKPDSAKEDKNRVNLHAITISFTVWLATLNKSKWVNLSVVIRSEPIQIKSPQKRFIENNPEIECVHVTSFSNPKLKSH